MSFTISITDDLRRQALLNFIESCGETQVVAGQDNLVPQPTGQYVVLQTLLTRPLSTNQESLDVTGLITSNARSMEWVCQVDVYGAQAGDRADLLAALVKTNYAIMQFAQSGIDMAPLYATEPRQTTMVNAEDQFEDRYTFEFHAHYNPVVTTPEQSATVLTITPIDVDVRFPPET